VAGVGGRLYPFVCLGTEPPVRCGEQPRRLRPSDVAVTWSQGDYGSGLSTPKPDLAPVPAACLALGAQGGTEVEYRSSLPNPEATLIHLVTACWRGPNLKTIRAQVQAMLASVKVTGLQASTTTAGYRCIAAELPVPGAWPAPNQRKLFCTSARVSVPNVLGVPLPRAVALLNQVGLFVAVKPTQTIADDTARVVAQDPAQEAIVVADSTVVLTASPTDKRKFTAECKDGFSTRVPIDQGACSDHGGVQTMLQ
jgi:hypothetical protein